MKNFKDEYYVGDAARNLYGLRLGALEESMTKHAEAEDTLIESAVDSSLGLLTMLRGNKDQTLVEEWLSELRGYIDEIDVYAKRRAARYTDNGVFLGDPETQLPGVDVILITLQEFRDYETANASPVEGHDFCYAYVYGGKNPSKPSFFALDVKRKRISPYFNSVYDCFNWIASRAKNGESAEMIERAEAK